MSSCPNLYRYTQGVALVALLFLWPQAALWAQDLEDELPQHPLTEHRHGEHGDSSHSEKPKRRLGLDLKLGHFEFHTRSFFMATQNRGELSDYSTLAAGAGLEYQSPIWKGFQFGFGGYFVFQLHEHNLHHADSLTGAGNRYEVMLYDMHDPENSHDLDRLEELYLRYQLKGLKLTLGRHRLHSPLLNEQDNRMRPNIFSGLSAEYKDQNWRILGAWLTAVNIRGTVDWYSIEESYGIYPFGRNHMGQPSDYAGNVHSRGILMGGVEHDYTLEHQHRFKNQVWNYTADQVFNLSFAQSEYSWHYAKHGQLNLGLQGFFQTAIKQGGNPDPHKAYILPDEKSWGLGARLGGNWGAHCVSANYLHIADKGRFLFPREWGREHFFVSLPRERFEGNGGLNALSLKYEWHNLGTEGFHGALGLSRVNVAHLLNYEQNKYGLPSYYHASLTLDYQFKGYLEGLDLRFILVHKLAQKPDEVPDEFRINRVDMWNYNLILDYRF